MASPRNVETTKPLSDGMEYVRFYDSDKENYIFANYWAFGKPLKASLPDSSGRMVECTFATPEHMFQAMKFLPCDSPNFKSVQNTPTANSARNQAAKLFFPNGRSQPPSQEAQNYWRQNQRQYASKADLQNSLEYKNMLAVVRARFDADPEFAATLAATGNAYILEDTYTRPPNGDPPDAKWGGGDNGMGENLLGMALMEIRNEKILQPAGQQPVDVFAERDKARAERAKIDAQLGGAENTKGKSLTALSNSINKPKGYRPSSGPKPVERLKKALDDMDMTISVNARGQIQLHFRSEPAATVFNNMFSRRIHRVDGDPRKYSVGLGQEKHVFNKLGVPYHGRTSKHDFADAIRHQLEGDQVRNVMRRKRQPSAKPKKAASSSTSTNKSKGGFENFEMDYTTGTAAQTRKILERADQTTGKVGITYSANSIQTNALNAYYSDPDDANWKAVMESFKDQANQGKVVEKVLKELSGKDHAERMRVRILPVTTIDRTRRGDKAATMKQVEDDMNAIADFARDGGMILGWQNQNVNGNNYAIGGGVAARIQPQDQADYIQQRLQGLHAQYNPPSLNLGQSNSGSGRANPHAARRQNNFSSLSGQPLTGGESSLGDGGSATVDNDSNQPADKPQPPLANNFLKLDAIKNALEPDGWSFADYDEDKKSINATQASSGNHFEIKETSFTTDQTELNTFVAMLKAFRVANPNRDPVISTDDPKAKRVWQYAYEKVYPEHKQNPRITINVTAPGQEFDQAAEHNPSTPRGRI